jgi:hypothetical protein
MRGEILAHLNDAKQLEQLYRSNRSQFKRDYNALPAELKTTPLAAFWNERLRYESDEINWGTRADLFFIIGAALIAGLIAKLPAILSIPEEFFYQRNIGFIIFPVLMAYFVWNHKLSARNVLIIVAATLSAFLFINFLPENSSSDTLLLSCVHVVLFLYGVLGFAFVGEIRNAFEKRLDYLKYNGDLVVMTTLIVIAGGIMTALTIGLFSVIGINIERFYFQNVVVFGLPAAPIFGTYLTRVNPNLVGKVSPVIAKIFSPLVLIMLVIYLFAMISSSKNPYNDREFLLIFNLLLIGVMAIIFFSVAAKSKGISTQLEMWILTSLSIVTLLVNGIALSAIIMRILEWGITPNRAAVLGANVLVLIHLILVTFQLFKVSYQKAEINAVGKAIAIFLPVYLVWTIVVTFLFPYIFAFR